jgi:hypothetical protein
VEPLKVLEKQRITLLKFMIFLKQVHFWIRINMYLLLILSFS